MKPSTTCFDFIMKEESCVLHAYKDSAGIVTIGYGSTMYKDGTKPKVDDVITQVRAFELLAWEIGNKAPSVSAFTQGAILTQNQYDSLVSFAYNAGIGALQSSTLLKKVRINPNDHTIRDEFKRWNKIHFDGRVIESKGLTARRAREADLYFS